MPLKKNLEEKELVCYPHFKINYLKEYASHPIVVVEGYKCDDFVDDVPDMLVKHFNFKNKPHSIRATTGGSSSAFVVYFDSPTTCTYHEKDLETVERMDC